MTEHVKPLVFRTVDGAPVVPSWLRHGAHQVAPAPFAQQPASEPEHEHEHEEHEPEPFPQRTSVREAVREATRESILPPLRRSSLPPRVSVPPPPVVITRQSSAPPPPRLSPAEQQAYAQAALELGSLRARVLANAEAQLLELAVSIAQVIIEREIERDPAIHGALARAAVAALGDTRGAKVRVSRAAYRAITEVYGEEALDVDGVRVELTLDNSLEGLSVIAEAGSSRVDGRVSERLAAVLRAMKADQRRRGSGDDE